ncbi:MAG TPA: shikimate kinase [Sphingobacteriaceae bacterium]
MIIFLVGFMGSGKTTLGKRLSRLLGYAFVDLDKVIESRAGATIPQYFQQHGEGAFRQLERECLQRGLPSGNAVVATGGGAPCYFDNMDWMNRHGVTVYLMLSPKALASRLKGSAERPLISGKSGPELVAFIEEKLAERESYYKKAACWVDGLNLTAEKLAEYIGRAES